MPVRKIRPSYRSVTGFIVTEHKEKASFESTLERDLLILLDFDNQVLRFEEQPVKIEFTHEGKSRSYVPDVRVEFRPEADTPTSLCEVKYKRELKEKWAELKPKFKAAKQFAESRGERFCILTEQQIRTPFLKNATFLKQYKQLPERLEQEKQIVDTLFELREATPAMVLAAIYRDKWNQARLLPYLYKLVANGTIYCDLSVPMTMSSEIWLPEAEEQTWT